MHKQFLFFTILYCLQSSVVGIVAQSIPKIHTTAFGADSISGPNVQMQYYYLYAHTVEDLQKVIEERRKQDPKAKHFMAKTRTHVRWNWEGYGKDTCNLHTLRLTSQIVVQFPRWQVPDYLPQADKKRWAEFIKALAEHELGHVKVALEELPKMEKRIRQADCRTADGHAKGAMEEMRQAQLRYDDATYHGWLQGAKF
ncbi:MAG: DUF922 domain-containing protein [Runella sp.]